MFNRGMISFSVGWHNEHKRKRGKGVYYGDVSLCGHLCRQSGLAANLHRQEVRTCSARSLPIHLSSLENGTEGAVRWVDMLGCHSAVGGAMVQQASRLSGAHT